MAETELTHITYNGVAHLSELWKKKIYSKIIKSWNHIQVTLFHHKDVIRIANFPKIQYLLYFILYIYIVQDCWLLKVDYMGDTNVY